MAASVPEQDKQVADLADRYYGHLLQAGGQGLSLNPLIDMSAPSAGRVLWSAGPDTLEGYEVSKLDADSAFFDPPDYERIGFGAEALQEGLWILMSARYAFGEDGWKERPGRGSHAFAHYDPLAASWTVVRARPGGRARDDGGWAAQWLPADDRIEDEEKAVIACIADETSALLDAASGLRDSYPAYLDLSSTLMRRAGASADPRDLQRMGAVLKPYSYLPMPLAHKFRIGAFGSLKALAVPLYRALAGKPQQDSSGIMATATVTEATLCPPYEQGKYDLARAAAAGPAAGMPPCPLRGDPAGPEPEGS